MKTKVLSIICAALLVCSAGCGKNEEKPIEADTAINVTVYKAKPTDIDHMVTYTGEIKALEETSVSAKATGTAQYVNVEIGDYVDAGTVLLSIDSSDYRLQYNQAKAAYNSAVAAYNSTTNGSMQQSTSQLKAAVDGAQLEYDNAKTNYDRMKTLFEMGAISQIEFDGAKTRLSSAELNLNTAKSNYDLTTNVLASETKASAQAAVDSAKAALDIAQNALNNTTVKAPISGYVSAKNINKGQLVAAGSPLFTIKNTDMVDAEINVTESMISYVRVGTKATVAVKSAQLDGIEGTVSVVNQVKNPQTGMYTVKVHINNSENLLKEGMFADVTLITEEMEDTIAIPSESIMQDGDELYVYTVNNDVASKSVITTGIVGDELTQILTGIKDGDFVVISGKEYISEKNNKVKIVED